MRPEKFLTAEQQDTVVAAVRLAEKGTSGEIRVHIDGECATRDANDKVKADKKNSVMTEDEAKASDKNIQDLTDKYIKEIDTITAAKTKEIMEI